MKDPLEEALEKMKPAEMPPSLMARLTAARPQAPEAKSRRSLFHRWIFPLASGACAAVATFAVLRNGTDPVKPIDAQPVPNPGQFVSDGYVLGTRDLGVMVGADRVPYRIMQVEWVERNTVPQRESAPGVRVETTRRAVIPVALDIN